ncbi:MAG: mechanosensitive ion channel domain-containing protein [Vicinamibacterales bacterium]
MRHYQRMIAGGLLAVAIIVGLYALLGHFGLAESEVELRELGHLLLTRGLKIVVIVVAALVVIRAATLAIGAIQQRVGAGSAQRDLEWQRRASTLGGILVRLVSSAVWFVAVLMLLRELTIDVLPLLTGAGIAGLAIGFGAQNLVRDVISGFFMILEDQVRVGDAARINGIVGGIEQVNLRTIVLRDGEGAVHVFPNGTVTALANLSKHFSFAIVDLRVAYDEHLERVFGTIREVGAAMKSDAHWGQMLLGDIEVLGVESIDGGLATVRCRFKTLPLKQASIANELRKRLLGAMVGRSIKPYSK